MQDTENVVLKYVIILMLLVWFIGMFLLILQLET